MTEAKETAETRMDAPLDSNEQDIARIEESDVEEIDVSKRQLTTTSDSSATTKSAAYRMDCGSTSAIRRVLCSIPDEFISEDTDPDEQTSLLEETDEALDDATLDQVTEDSDIRRPDRRIWVVTTAAMPWRTGTAVNPLLRALYLSRGRPKHYVTLVIPWLEDDESRELLYGSDNTFLTTGHEGQEQWIRLYCRERAHCPAEEQNLKILFYPATYHRAFGSIFPSVDICSLIPDEEADVAILEEPEHLNWFRAPPLHVSSSSDEKKFDASSEGNLPAVNARQTGDAPLADHSNGESTSDTENIADEVKRDKAELGWAHKFRHVLGILHTNYSAYMSQYAVGTSFIAAPAIAMLSSIVVRAYCHRVIRLSAALPSLAPHKEVTSNVHGVRSEFLLPPLLQNMEQRVHDPPASVYFIGKLMWAKGFDKILRVQELLRNSTGAYFAIDIYGSGPDEKAISRAFFGRQFRSPKEPQSPVPNEADAPSTFDLHAASVFKALQSLRQQVGPKTIDTITPEAAAIEVTPDGESPTGSAVHITTSELDQSGVEEGTGQSSHPFSIITDVSGKTLTTGIATSQAVYSLVDSVVKAGLKMTFTMERQPSEEDSDNESRSIYFDPPQSRFEWRRHPIPARFLGVKDHALIRDVPEHKIFLNTSTTEVLCTTTAEALAMGKFVIIPKHPSNEFFLQFPNCLAYETMEECVEKLEWALDKTPAPLADELLHEFTWEAATDRLFEASKITRREVRERRQNGTDQADARMAWFHSESGKTGQQIGKVFGGSRSVMAEKKQIV